MRPLFGLERVWLVADRTGPPFVNQLVVEGLGAPDAAAWGRALSAVNAAWPSPRLHGVLGFTTWRAGGAPATLRRSDEAIDGRAPTPPDPTRLDPMEGPLIEVVLHPSAVRVRTHHAAFDGQSAWALAKDLGAALRGEPLLGGTLAAVEPPGGQARPVPTADAPLPFPAGPDTVWIRRTLPPRPSLLAHALRTWVTVSGRGRASIPVDLRRQASMTAQHVANLTGFVYLEASEADTVEQIRTRLVARLPGAVDAVRTAERLTNVPLWALAAAGRSAVARARAKGRGESSLTLSNLGLQDASMFDHPGFEGRALYWIPPVNPGTPLFLTLTGHAGGVEVCAGACSVDAATLAARMDAFSAAW
jgi:hypothetical protein